MIHSEIALGSRLCSGIAFVAAHQIVSQRPMPVPWQKIAISPTRQTLKYLLLFTTAWSFMPIPRLSGSPDA
jgi:hypothetical protein